MMSQLRPQTLRPCTDSTLERLVLRASRFRCDAVGRNTKASAR